MISLRTSFRTSDRNDRRGPRPGHRLCRPCRRRRPRHGGPRRRTGGRRPHPDRGADRRLAAAEQPLPRLRGPPAAPPGGDAEGHCDRRREAPAAARPGEVPGAGHGGPGRGPERPAAAAGAQRARDLGDRRRRRARSVAARLDHPGGARAASASDRRRRAKPTAARVPRRPASPPPRDAGARRQGRPDRGHAGRSPRRPQGVGTRPACRVGRRRVPSRRAMPFLPHTGNRDISAARKMASGPLNCIVERHFMPTGAVAPV